MFSGCRERVHWEQMGNTKDFIPNIATIFTEQRTIRCLTLEGSLHITYTYHLECILKHKDVYPEQVFYLQDSYLQFNST